mgnify:CR=1 FL=1
MIVQEPLISVLMTTYNREKYVAFAVESVLNSTYRNLELIIVDDGSKDNTVGIAEGIAARDKRVKVHINEKNLGDYPNRNKAASLAQGKYIKYVDADDYIYPTGLQVLVSMMEQFPDAGYGLCSLPQNIHSPYPIMMSPVEAYTYHYNGPGLFHKAPLSSIIRTDVFREAGGFDNIRMAGDFEMWHRLSQKYPVLLMPEGVVWYREHDAQEINSFDAYITVYEKIKHQYLLHENCPLDKNTVSAILSARKRGLYKQLLKNVLFFQSKQLGNTLKKLNFKHRE